jgi:hypothetical protein
VTTVNVPNHLPNSPHLNVDDAFELLAAYAPFIPGRAQTMFDASECCAPCSEWQLGYLRADPLRHFPALSCYLVELPRHLGLRSSAQYFVASHNRQVHGRPRHPMIRMCLPRHARQKFRLSRPEIRLPL